MALLPERRGLRPRCCCRRSPVPASTRPSCVACRPVPQRVPRCHRTAIPADAAPRPRPTNPALRVGGTVTGRVEARSPVARSVASGPRVRSLARHGHAHRSTLWCWLSREMCSSFLRLQTMCRCGCCSYCRQARCLARSCLARRNRKCSRDPVAQGQASRMQFAPPWLPSPSAPWPAGRLPMNDRRLAECHSAPPPVGRSGAGYIAARLGDALRVCLDRLGLA